MQEEELIEEYVDEADFEPQKDEDWQSKLMKFLDSRYFVVVCLVLVAISSFSLGRISKIKATRAPVRIISENKESNMGVKSEVVGEVKGVSVVVPEEASGQVVASKNGTKYHYPWCAGAKQISAQNKITFNSIEEARAKGLTPALNCKGLR